MAWLSNIFLTSPGGISVFEINISSDNDEFAILFTEQRVWCRHIGWERSVWKRVMEDGRVFIILWAPAASPIRVSNAEHQ
jgi:hypothetical protein